MEPKPDRPCALSTRWSGPADAAALAALHAGCWRYAYAGVIPEPGLSRMIARRGPGWWRRLHASGGRVLVAELPFDLGNGPGAESRPKSRPEIVGYALIGRCRSGPGGELQEIYLVPACQGLGFGRRLFAAARAELRARGIAPLTVWCLAANGIGTAFYRALGGEVTARARDRIAGAELEKLRFTWP